MRAILAAGCAAVVAALLGSAAAQAGGPVTVTRPSRAAESEPLSRLRPAHWAAAPQELRIRPRPLPAPAAAFANGAVAGASPRLRARARSRLQNSPGGALLAQPAASFAGLEANGSVPPDANIAVGTSYIVQVVNGEIGVFDKSGTLLDGYPKKLESLWQPLGGDCAREESGDPIVQYDALAPDGVDDGGTGRWIITELGSLRSPYSECIAVSQTSDPTGTYHLYAYSFGNELNDYPKFGVWPTATNGAYLASYNLFSKVGRFAGTDLCAYDRTALLAGVASPAQLCTLIPDFGALPSDLDGATPPPDGTPGYFLDFGANILRLYEASPDFAAATLDVSGPLAIAVSAFRQACGGGTCIPQPGTGRALDSLADRLMYRLAYRVFAHHAAMVVNHSVAADGAVGARWYELRGGSSAPFDIFQSGTFVPDAADRWMGSIAADAAGDLALGYSEASGSLYPGVAYTGRVPGDPLGRMESEAVIQAGGGSQTGSTRWGDYSAMRIDPSDDCTFWYTNEYYPATARHQWSTVIGAFRFPSCQ